MNKFNIGDRVWHVCYGQIDGIIVRECLVVGIDSYLDNLGVLGVVEKCVKQIQYELYEISSTEESNIQYLCDEGERFNSNAKRVFEDKEEAFHYLDKQLLGVRDRLADK